MGLGMTYAQALAIVRELASKQSRTKEDDDLFRSALRVVQKGMFAR